ncbi:MAG: flagellar hook-associated protein FlgK [Actinobacteria bacterium]|nr:flagellar hook-associated protein FlgK [Actinomycetota bacterium]
MSSAFFGLQVALSGLRAQRQVMETAGHNIANASTEGYTRQRVLLTPGVPYTMPGLAGPVGALMKGTGVEAREVTRVADLFIDAQLREQSGALAEKRQASQTVSQVEGVFGEPGEEGLGAAMSAFWGAWEELTLNPDSLAVRRSLIYQADSLAGAFNRINRQLESTRENLDFEVEQSAEAINRMSAAVASLNARIARAGAGGMNANDLIDERDRLISELRSYVDVRVRLEEGGRASLFVGNRALVMGDVHNEIVADKTGTGYHFLVWKSDAEPLSIGGGKLASMLEMRDTYIPRLIADLDALAASIIQEVNALHAGGYDLDGNPVAGTAYEEFFTGTSMADMAVNPAIEADPKGVAASAGSGEGDAENARAIALLREKKSIAGAYTFEDYYRSVVARVGIDAQAMENEVENTEVLLKQIENWRESVSGVYIDEEMVRLQEAQRAFQAAARAISVMDDALNTIINGMGVVGR